MYNIIAVDDESLALRRFEHIIKKEKRVNLVSTFTNPLDAIAYIRDNTIDIAFLDIEMPQINGLELAGRIQEIDPYINIIFVTAFDQYALDAFKAHAIGYLLKPLDISEFSKQIDQYALSRPPRETKPVASAPSKKLVVHCLGQFNCFPSGSPNEPISFRTTKTAELFALLVHHYKAPITKYYILDALFPDMDYEKSNKLFYVSCSYLRSAFAKADITDVLLRENDSYRINTDIMTCDYIDLMKYAEQGDLSAKQLQEAVDLYEGKYMMGRSYEWAFETAAYVDNLFERLLFRLVDAYVTSGNRNEAYQLLNKYLISDPLNEETVFQLMKLHVEDGRKDIATTLYRTYEAKLEEQLDAVPSANLRALLR